MKRFIPLCIFPQIVFSQFAESPISLSAEFNTIKPQSGKKISVTSTEIRLGFPLVLKPGLIIAANASHERHFYDSDIGFNELLSTKASLFALYDINSQWRAMGISTLSTDHESGVNIGDAIQFSGIYGTWYSGFENILIGGGFGVSTGIDNNLSGFPIIILDWQFAEKFTLTTRPTPGTRFGPGVSLLYKHSDPIALFLGARYINEEYLLMNEDVYSHDTARAFATLQYQFSNNVSVNTTLGLNFAGSIELENTNSKTDLDPSVFGAINVSWDF